MKRITSVFAIILMSTVLLYPSEKYTVQPSNPLYETWRWKSFTGLADKSVRCFTEGKDQSMWFGTAKGIFHYDGIHWERYYDEDTVIQASVYGLCYTKSDMLYAVTTRGICHFTSGKWINDLIFPDKGILGSEWEILNLKETHNGDIWVGVYFGLIRITSNGIKIYTTPPQIKGFENYLKNVDVKDVTGVYDGLKNFIIYDLLEDRSENLWLATEEGQIIRLFNKNHDIDKPGKYTLYTKSDGLIMSRLPILFESSEGSIYAISQSVQGGVNRFDQSTNTWSGHKLSEDFGGDDINFSVCETRDGVLWIGGFARIFALSNGVWAEYKPPDLPVPATRIDLQATSDGSLWLAGHLADMFRIAYETPLWKTYKDLNYECTSPNGRQWYLDAAGKVIYHDPNTESWEMLDDEFPMSDPVRLYCDRQGMLWALGSNEGGAALAYYKNGIWKLKSFADLCWAFHPNAVFQSRDNSLWFGVNADCGEGQWGIVRYMPDKGDPSKDIAWKTYPGTEICEVAYALGETENNSLLCGYFKGLLEYNGDTIRSLHKVLNTDIIKVESIAQDAARGVWIASRSMGVFHYINDNEWTQYTTEDGLVSNSTSSVLVAQDSTVWVATDKGISRFDGKKWIKYALPAYFKIIRGSGVLQQGTDGSIWVNIATIEWYRRVYFKQEYSAENSPMVAYRIMPEKEAPETEITEYREKVYYPGNVRIFWDGTDKWNVTEPDELQFSFQLDKDKWSDYTPEKSHTFLAMHRGWHTLRVRARDNFLNVDPQPAEVKFKVIPPLWGQIWFIFLMLMIVAVIAFLFISSLKKSREMEIKNQAMNQKNEELVQQQKEIEEKGKQIMELLEKEKDSKWFNEGIILVHEVIKKNKSDLESLVKGLLGQLTEYLEINSAGIFLFRSSGNSKAKNGYLELIAAFGFDGSMLEKKEFSPEEGLVGACFSEKKTLVVPQIPDTYFIGSGLGEAKAQGLVLIPLKIHDDVVGVLEVASFNQIEERTIRFLETVSENIASNVMSINTKEQIENMYQLSQEQSAKMHEQDEELRQQMEELKATQEASERREQKLTAELEEYRQEAEKLKKEIKDLKAKR